MNRAGLGPLCYMLSGCMVLSTWLWEQREDEKCRFTHGRSRAFKFRLNKVYLSEEVMVSGYESVLDGAMEFKISRKLIGKPCK